MLRRLYWLPFLILLYGVLLLLKKNDIYFGWFIDGYLTDLLAVPVILGIALILLRKYTGDYNLTLDWIKIAVCVLLLSVVFEYWLPLKSKIYTSDIGDVVCYFLGGLFFYWTQKSPIENNRA